MNFSDTVFIFKWWFVLFTIGLVFLPLTTTIFKNFFDKGYIFARILGMALISYVIFVLGILKLLPFTEFTISLVILGFLIFNIFIISKYPNILISLKSSWKVFLIEEFIFLITLFFWSYIRAHQPDIHGLEKYEDFGFINSILRSEYFPPADMWFTPLSINYYYFGHLITAVLTKLSTIPSFITFNLMLATIFALTFTGAFSIAANLYCGFAQGITRIGTDLRLRSAFICGLLSGFLVTLSGNLHTIYTFFKPYPNENPVPFWQLIFSPDTFPNSYWYPNATRFIHNTIHEFPLYSFVVSDLHAHVLDMPFVLLTIAVLLSLINSNQAKQRDSGVANTPQNDVILASKRSLRVQNPFRISNLGFRILLLAFLLAVMYMTNAWDGVIYLLLAILVLLYVQRQRVHYDRTVNTTNQ